MSVRAPDRPLWALLALLLSMASTWSALALWTPERPHPPAGSVGRDYASYHYAARVALSGGDPYDTEALDRAAKDEGIRRAAVHPWIYPPPALLLVAPTATLSLDTGLQVFRVLGELALLGAIAVLCLWWSPLGSQRVLALLAITLALMSGVAYGSHLGQMNSLVFLLAMAGLAVEERSPVLGGVLLGLAIMGKLSPVLFVGLWLVERRWRALGGVAIGVATSEVVSLALVGLQGQIHFWTRVLPGLGAGDYNGLRIKISMFANHSIPNLLDQWFPGDDGLSPAAHLGSFALAGLLLGLLALAFRRPTADPLTRAARVGAIGVAMLLIPVYTFDHHLLWSAPAIVAVSIALAEHRLPRWAVVPAGLAFTLVCFGVPPLKRLYGFYEHSTIALAIQEAKHLALWIWLVLATWVGLSPPRQS